MTGGGTELAARLARDGVPVRAGAVAVGTRPARAAGASSPSCGSRRAWCTRTTRTPSRSAASAPRSRAGRSSPRAGSTSRSAGAASGAARPGSSRSRAPSPTCSWPTASRASGSRSSTQGSISPRSAGPPGWASASRLGLPPDAIVAANVAALVPHKDHATLLRAAAALADRLPGAPLGRGRRRGRAGRARAPPRGARARPARPPDRSPRGARASRRRRRLLRHELARGRARARRCWTPWPLASRLRPPPPAGSPRCCRTVQECSLRRTIPGALADAVARLLTEPGLGARRGGAGHRRGGAIHGAAHGRGGPIGVSFLRLIPLTDHDLRLHSQL